MSERAVLAGRIRASLDDVRASVVRAKRMAEKGRRTGDDDYWDGVALNLHGFYSGIEEIFEAVARMIDGAMPEGGDWHISLLRQMTIELGDLRPAVISMETRRFLDDFRGLRHVIRNVYAFNLNPARLSELTDNASGGIELLAVELLAFADFLDRTA